MGYSFLITTLLLSATLTRTLADVSSLQDENQNQDHLDPLQDQDQDLSNNNQDKRTICSALNKCGGSNYVKRLVIRGGPKHQLVGYAPVLRPVGVRPVILGGYSYPKPKVHFRLKAPNAVIHGGWKAVQTAPTPVKEVVRPVNHVDVIHNNPVPHVDHVGHHHNVAAPVHVDHVHVRPDHVHLQTTQPAFVHLKPVAAPAAHVDQVHQINIPHGNHYDTFTHIDHFQPAAVLQTVTPLPAVIKPFAPSPVLFEVTRPNLGVLPLGARFPTPILREVPHHVHFNPAPAIPVATPALVPPLHHHHHHVPAVQGIIHTPVGLPPVVPQPGVSVEYHGTRNYLPFFHQAPVGAVQPHLHQGINFGALHPHQHLPVENTPHAFAPQQALPFEHGSHGFAAPQQALPFEHASHGFAAPQQALPHEHSTQFLSPEQQLPYQTSPHFQQHLQAIQQYQEVPQGQLPLEGEQQQNFDQFLPSNQETFSSNSLNTQNFDQSNVIQPGQTDLQIPYHLPQHGGWDGAQQGGLQEESRGFGDQVFRPSQQLEAPYTK